MGNNEACVEYRVPVSVTKDGAIQDLLRHLARARGVRRVTVRAAVNEALDLFIKHYDGADNA
jgi:hypothetical protein